MGKYKVLFIHGAGGTESKWRTAKEYCQLEQYEVIDLPGHGKNEFNIITSIEDYAAFIDQSIKEETIVVGHSMGGLIALELAARNKKVKGIVLVASFYELPVHPKIINKLEEGEFPSSLFHASYSTEISEDLLEIERKEISKVPIEIISADFKACNNYSEGKNKLSTLEIPICAILGNQDRLLPVDTIKLFKSVKPEIEIIEIEGSGHYVMLEKPKQFFESMKKFIEELGQQKV